MPASTPVLLRTGSVQFGQFSQYTCVLYITSHHHFFADYSPLPVEECEGLLESLHPLHVGLLGAVSHHGGS